MRQWDTRANVPTWHMEVDFPDIHTLCASKHRLPECFCICIEVTRIFFEFRPFHVVGA